VPPIEEAEDAVGGFDSGGGPGPQQGAYKEIVVSISAQSLWAYEGGELVVSTLVSTGIGEVPETVTPVGYFAVWLKYDVQTMEGTISGEHYRVEDVPYVMYFDGAGNALHGTYWHSNFGTPMSHGCVNLPLDVAAFLYGWAPEGTAVSIIP
jgi:lipoprotein-anchoring transpeptidase ErfK/SrfK